MVHALEQAEVEEGDAAVVQQDEVARMGVAGELAVAVEAAQEEAEDDLPDPVALGLGTGLQLLEARAADELAHEDPLARERATTSGTKMNGCPAKIRDSERWFWASSS